MFIGFSVGDACRQLRHRFGPNPNHSKPYISRNSTEYTLIFIWRVIYSDFYSLQKESSGERRPVQVRHMWATPWSRLRPMCANYSGSAINRFSGLLTEDIRRQLNSLRELSIVWVQRISGPLRARVSAPRLSVWLTVGIHSSD